MIWRLPMNQLSQLKIDALREAFERGGTTHGTAREVSVGVPTVIKYFRRFIAAGVVRGVVRDQRRKDYRSSRYDPPTRVYRGPDWIGKAAD